MSGNRPSKESALNLAKFIDRKIIVKLAGGRESTSRQSKFFFASVLSRPLHEVFYSFISCGL